MESINSLKEKYTELQESSAKEIKGGYDMHCSFAGLKCFIAFFIELQAALDRANEEAKEKEDSIEKILSGIEARVRRATNHYNMYMYVC